MLFNELDANLANVGTRGEVLKCLDSVLFGKGELLLDGQTKALAGNESHDLLQKLSRSNDNTADNSSLGKSQAGDIGHLLGLRKETDNGDVTSHFHGVNTLSDSSRTAVLENVIDTLAVGDLHNLLGPLGVSLVVDGVVCTVCLLHELKFLITRRSDDNGSTGGLG